MNRKIYVNEQLLIDILYTSDRRAFSFLHDTFSPTLHGSLIDLVETDRESVGQMLDDVFLAARNVICTYDKRKQKLFIWMLHMVRRITIAALRHLNAWPGASELEEISLGLRKTLLRMDKGQRQVIELMYYKGYSRARVARSLNTSIETVDNLLQSGLSQLRLCLNAFTKTDTDGTC